jgi:6-phosphofructokinase 2
VPRIVTLTLNPALDVTTATDRVQENHKLRCSTARTDPGGGGVNVARVIHRLGGDVLAIYAAGGLTGTIHRALLAAEGVPHRIVPIDGSTRQSFTVDETSTGREFRFVLEGPEMGEPEWRSCLDAVANELGEVAFVVASGSLPPGVPDDFYARAARLARDRGAQFVLDGSGPALAEALREGVHLVAPSRRELAGYLGVDFGSDAGVADAAARLVESGAAQLVAVTLGESGALLAGDGIRVRLPVPSVPVRSTVGAGDSFLAAFVLRLAQGCDPVAAFRWAVAAGSAAVMTPGTQLCRVEDVERLEAELATP